MAWKKSSPALVERFQACLPLHPDLVPRNMFGYPAAFVHGNFFAGLFQEQCLVRLPGDLRDKFPALAKAEVFNPMGKGAGMTNFWVLPAGITKDAKKLAALLLATFIEVEKLPAKVKKPPKPKKTAAAAKKRTKK